MITEEQLTESQALCDAASKGPWHVLPPFTLSVGSPDMETVAEAYHREEDAAFIAAARTGWPEATAEVRRLQEDAELSRSAVILANTKCAEAEDEVRRLQESIGTLMSRISEERDEHVKVEAKLEMERDEARRERCLDRSRACPHTIAVELYGTDQADLLFPPKKKEEEG